MPGLLSKRKQVDPRGQHKIYEGMGESMFASQNKIKLPIQIAKPDLIASI